MRRSYDHLLGAVSVVLVAMLACVYKPSFEEGVLHCHHPTSGEPTCPKGYTCGSDDTCYKAGSATGTAGTTGAPLTVDDFMGHWLFAPGSTQTINCSDGSTNTKSIATDYVDITAGVATALQASYYCDWNLTVDTPPKQTTIAAGQSCTTTSADMTKFTWHGSKFDFKTSDGLTGTLQAEITANYTDALGVMGTCTVKISGNLTNAGLP